MELDLSSILDKLNHHLENQDRDLFGTPEAAVLVPFFEKDNNAHLLFIRRATHLDKHSGQISFPGGKIEENDDGIIDTALRETEEEVGIDKEDIEVIGTFDDFATPYYKSVSSVIGYFQYPVPYSLSDEEIDEIIEIPIHDLLDPTIYHSEIWEWKGEDHEVHFYDWEAPTGTTYTIWGATAYLLHRLLAIIKLE